MELNEKIIKSGKIFRNATFMCFVLSILFLMFDYIRHLLIYDSKSIYLFILLTIPFISGLLLLIGLLIKNKSIKYKYYNIQYKIILGVIVILFWFITSRYELTIFNSGIKTILITNTGYILLSFNKHSLTFNYTFIDENRKTFIKKLLIKVLIIAGCLLLICLLFIVPSLLLPATNVSKIVYPSYIYKSIIVVYIVSILMYFLISLLEKFIYDNKNNKVPYLIIGLLIGSIYLYFSVRYLKETNNYGYNHVVAIFRTYSNLLIMIYISFLGKYFEDNKVMKKIILIIMFSLVICNLLSSITVEIINILFMLSYGLTGQLSFILREIYPYFKHVGQYDTLLIISYSIIPFTILTILKGKKTKLLFIPMVIIHIGYLLNVLFEYIWHNNGMFNLLTGISNNVFIGIGLILMIVLFLFKKSKKEKELMDTF